MLISVMFVLLALLMLMGIPIAFALLIVSALYFLTSPVPDEIMVQQLISGVDSFPLLAVAFFVFLGSVMAKGGIAERLVTFVDTIVGHYRGGLAQVNVFNSVLLGGMSGSANADAAIDSKILVPVMVRRGYSRGFSAALSAASGMISPMIPPGLGLIIYGLLADVSIGKLFMGGIIPALLMAVALSGVVAHVARQRGYGAERESRAPFRLVFSTGVKAGWVIAMPIILFLGLRVGVFTPTELGAAASIYAILVTAVFYRDLRPRDFGGVLLDAVSTTATIMLIISAATVFGWILTIERVPQALVALLLGISDEPWVILLILNAALLLLGMVLESNSLLVILAPMLAPVALQLGIDPVHFGVVMVLNLTIGSMTPPIGTVLFTVCSVTGCTPEEYSKEAFKFIAALIAVLLVCSMIPQLVTWLPNLLLP